MALEKIKLGELIEQTVEENTNLEFGADSVKGMTIEKTIIPTKANMMGTDLTKFLIVRPNDFIYNPRTHGKRIGLGFNNTNDSFLISWNNVAFRVKKSAKNKVLPTYLYMNFKRLEWDRRACFDSWGSSTEVFAWDDFCDMDIELPDIEIQKKFVSIYLSVLKNQKCYEKGLDDLKLACEGYIERIRKTNKPEPIISYLDERTETNKKGTVSLMKGVGMNGFIEPNQERSLESLRKCNIFYKGDFVYAPSSFKNGVIAYNDKFDKAICTEEYIVFSIKDYNKLNPYYLLMWLKREQLGRYIDFVSCDSVRNRFYFKDLDIVELPIPSIDEQNKIAELYKCYLVRKEINERLKNQIMNICPALIKGSINEAIKE